MMHFRRGLRDWRRRFVTIAASTRGIEWLFCLILYSLSLLSVPQLRHIISFGRAGDGSVDNWTEWYVVVALVISILIFYFFPSGPMAWLSTYFSASTIIVVLNIVFLQRALEGTIQSPERSLLLFICNVVQIVFMFATWYSLYGEEHALLTSVLTLATISYSETTPRIAMAQIATDFVLLAVYLSHLMGRVGGRGAS